MLVLNCPTRNLRTQKVYLFGHPEPKPSGHKKYNVMNNVSTHTSYTTKHLRSLVLKKIHVVN